MFFGPKAPPAQPIIPIKVRDVTPRGRDRMNPRFEVSGRDASGKVRRVEIDVPPEIVLEANGIEKQMRLWELARKALNEQR